MKMRMILLPFLCAVFLFAVSCGHKAPAAPGENADITALTNCVIIDGTGSAAVVNGVILIRDNRIVKVGGKEKVLIPDGSRVVDLGGRTAMPGFINAHVHKAYEEENLKNWLMGGVTTVRDMGPHYYMDIIAYRDENNKKADTARIVSGSAILTVTNGYGSDYFESADQAKEKANFYIDNNIDFIKFSIEDFQQGRRWEMPTEAETKALVDTAHANGKKASVHITHEKFLNWAIRIGVDDLGHMVVEPISEEICEKLVESNIYWIPTLELWAGVSKMHRLNWDKIAINNLSTFHKAGGRIALGTDFAGYTCEFDKGFPITEVKLLSEAGLSNMEIITAGTLNAAYVCGMEKELGSLEAGKIADILVVDGDPLENIEALWNTYMVFHNGQQAFSAGGR